MFKFLIILLIIKITNASSQDQHTKIFEIQWSNSRRPTNQDNFEQFDVTSSLGEKYTCFIQNNEPENLLDKPFYKGPLAIDFIEYLFNKGICSYRLDPFWTYEVCHGRHIRQYNEVLDGSTLKLMHYTLGIMEAKEREMIFRKKREEETENILNSTFKIPTKKVENKELPYVKFTMTDGSLCEHNRRKLRKSHVYYMCDINANHDIHSVTEVTSCVYEIFILTPLLCLHPRYRPRKIPTSPIMCYATGKAPRIPYNLAKIYWERRRILTKADKKEERTELISYDKKLSNSLDVDPSVLRDFLSGKNCISGGTGGWKYEFCYGKYVNQYTYGILGLRTTVCLGKFNMEKHLEWLRNRPYKRPKPVEYRTFITQFYTDGCVSNVTGRPRQTEVRLTCLRNSANSNALVMYLYETNLGEYLLGIESPMLCNVIKMADEDSLIIAKT